MHVAGLLDVLAAGFCHPWFTVIVWRLRPLHGTLELVEELEPASDPALWASGLG